MKIVSWNVRHSKRAFSFATESLGADVLMLQESSLLQGAPLGWSVRGANLDEGGKKLGWGTHILSRLPLGEVTIETRYQGSMTVATVTARNGLTLGLINIYGMFEKPPGGVGESKANLGLHRKLSDLGWWFYGLTPPKVDGFILAGDLNHDRRMDTHPTFRKKGRRPAATLFNRITDFGLVDLLREEFPEGVQTHWHIKSSFPWQLDHVFLSPSIGKVGFTVDVLQTEEVLALSDHAPVVLELNL